MDTNGLNHETHEIHENKGRFRTTNGHEWTRMDTNGLNHETHEIHETRAEVQNHETHE